MRLEFGFRRVQFIDGSAYINLPFEWVKTCKLGRGDRVSIMMMENGRLEIALVDEKGGCP